MIKEDPEHSILSRAFEYELVEFCYRKPEYGEPYIDLVFRKDNKNRRLRFLAPRDIRIEGNGFFPSTIGLEILNVSGRQMEGVGVRVHNYEASSGPPEFWARSVEEIPAISE
jgi:hypothetical protein